MRRVNDLKVKEIDALTIFILACKQSLVKVRDLRNNLEDVYRLNFYSYSINSPIVLMLESSKDHNGRYLSCSYHSPKEYGRTFEITEIFSN